LADTVDGLILYDIDVDPVTSPEPEPAPAGNGRSTYRLSSPGRQQLPEVISTIEDIVRSERQAGRTPLLTSLKQRVMRRIPGFDEKALGFSGFKKMMQRAAQEGNIKLVTVGLVDWVLMADEPDPQEPPAETPQTSDTSQVSVAKTSDAQRPLEFSSDDPQEIPEQTKEETKQPAVPAENGNGRRGRFARPAMEPAQSQVTTRDQGAVLAEEVPNLQLPEGPDDGQDAQRVADLIIMSDALEHREGISHVAFNFLVGEVAQALTAGLEAEQPEITQHWGELHSRIYITRLIRSLSDQDIFQRGWHTGQDEDTGRSKRRRTFNLNHGHPLVEKVLADQWGEPASQDGIADETAGELPLPATDQAPAYLPEPADAEDPVLDEAANEGAIDSASGINRVLRFFGRS
jgi:hypothetical protein